MTISVQAQRSFMQDMLTTPTEFKLINQRNINSTELEFSPALYGNQVVYIGNGRKDAGTQKSTSNYYNIYAAQLQGDTLLYGEKPFADILNSAYHEGPLCFNHTLDTIYFTRNNQLEGGAAQKLKRLGIYMSFLTPDGWAEPREFLPASETHSFCHPALTQDGKKMIFSSNLSGGYGNYDLYYIQKTVTGWSQPYNLGPAVNSPDNELFPTIPANGILSFSSNRPGGFGGLDLYISLLSGGGYDQAIILDPIFNSPSDELGLVYDAANNWAYFSSNRPGGKGQDDIYTIVYHKAVSKEPVATNIILLEEGTKRRVRNVELIIEQVDDKSNQIVGTTDRDGSLSVKLLPGAKYTLRASDLYFQPLFEVIEGATEPIYVSIRRKPCFKISGIAYDNENKERLSKTKIYLFASCNETQDSTITDLQGKFSLCIVPGCFGKLKAEHNGFYDVTLPLDTVKGDLLLNLNFEKIKVSIVKEPVRVGTVISLDNIYYNFNQWGIREGAERELNELVTLMQQYPAMEVKLVAHTDTRGDDASNLKLSVLRAEAAKDYVVRHGIAPARIQTEGRGETQPRNRCKNGVNCTEDEHQYNRRTEVVILKK